MLLLSEMANEQEVEMLIEQTAQGKKYYIEGRWATANQPNRNGRVYPGAVMESALGKYSTDYISQKRALGELNHPQGPTVNLDRASHIIENLKMDGDFVTGRAKVMDTPMGIIAKSLIDEGVRLGVSTRGLGSLKQTSKGINEVQSDFFIAAIDLVSDPSGPGCWVSGIMEGVSYEMLSDGRIQQVIIDQAKRRIDEEKAFKQLSALFESFKK